MRLVRALNAWADYLYWQRTDKKMLKRTNALIKEIMRHPFSGIGKPPPLKQNLSGYWSRRIDKEHRLIYKVEQDTIFVAQCRYHYKV